MAQGKRLSVLLFTLLLTAMTGCAGSRTQESTAEYVDDSLITSKVKAAILQDPDLKSREINVETFKGRVQLSGFVGSPSDINRASEVARHVNGVKSVANDLRVK